eukprot:TRINITY_DN19315_c0_g1_i1.p1 TRINITY_DN19315_c0_g1~~TRINITY_DN19315_c0_g1_i1.p1  ORF type:complete len:291 (-),score=34.00 TRINITY_DN19315_c0_g1_i1:485-1357(-)
MALVSGKSAVVRGHVGTIQEYASRIYKRFPQLFVTLGRDDLPAAFDLSRATTRVAIRKSSECMVVQLRMPRRDAGKLERQHSEKFGHETLPSVHAAATHSSNDFMSRCDESAPPESAVGSLRPVEEDDSDRTNSFTSLLRSNQSLCSSADAKCVATSISTASTAGDIKTFNQYGSDTGEQVVGNSSMCQETQQRSSATALASREQSEYDAISSPAEKSEGQPCKLRWQKGGAEWSDRTATANHVGSTPWLSAASLARLSEKRLRSGFVNWVDPGKPTLSYPGSHCPWRDF